MCRIPEPHEIADAHYARLEAEHDALVRYATCSDCCNYNEAPDEWCKVPHGWCAVHLEHVEGVTPVKDECESFEPTNSYLCRDDFEEERDWDDWDE